jgi:DNA-binding CsgD family transcriptional regulator/N-acetylneuraminic acid mutarotase
MDQGRESLTQREVEILEMVATGVTNREIAYRLGISANTVKVHLRNVYSKLNAESRTEATVIAAREGIVHLGGATTEEAETPLPEPTTPLPAWRRATLVAAALLVLASLAAAWPSSAAESGQTAELPLGHQGSQSQPGSAAAQESSWSERAQMPTRRAYLAVAAVEGQLLAIAGLTPDGTTAAVERYDPHNDLWSRGQDKPAPVFGVSGVVLGGEVFVPGGCDTDLNPLSVVEVYDPTGDSWRNGSPLPEARCAYALAVFEERIYLFGGWNGSKYAADTYVYDAQADRWSRSAPMDAGRGFLSASTLGGLIYVIGGYDGAQELKTCSVFDPGSQTWSSCPPLAVGRAALGLAALDGQLYAIGAAGETTYLGFNERYSPQASSWSAIETPLVGEWRGPGVAVLEGRVYAIGGGWDNGQLGINQTYEPLPFRIFVPVSRQQ